VTAENGCLPPDPPAPGRLQIYAESFKSQQHLRQIQQQAQARLRLCLKRHRADEIRNEWRHNRSALLLPACGGGSGWGAASEVDVVGSQFSPTAAPLSSASTSPASGRGEQNPADRRFNQKPSHSSPLGSLHRLLISPPCGRQSNSRLNARLNACSTSLRSNVPTGRCFLGLLADVILRF